MIKHGVIKDSFRLLGVNHKERLRKINQRREEMQKRIVERTSYKENMQKKREELERIQEKRDEYELKNMGNYRRVFP